MQEAMRRAAEIERALEAGAGVFTGALRNELDRLKRSELNPSIHCNESRHIEEPDHLGFVGLDFPFGRKKLVDNDPEVR